MAERTRPTTLKRVIIAALVQHRRKLRKELEKAITKNAHSGGILWEDADAIHRRLRTVEIMIEEWKATKK